MELKAPSTWHCVDFISDLHLQAREGATFSAWAAYLQGTPADAVFILGDLFEVWVGDDAARVADSFEAACVRVLRQAGERLALFIMQGNRDFLMGPQLMADCQARALDDPSVLEFAGQRWLLSHGDALCLQDLEYQVFRQQVRSPQWQSDFLSKPLAERQSIARGIRAASMARQSGSALYGDVDDGAARQWLVQHGASQLVHGHTHRPADHVLSATQRRMVLSDWDLTATPARAEVLRLGLPAHGGPHVVRLGLAGATASSPD